MKVGPFLPTKIHIYAVLNGPRTGRLRDHLLELDGYENIVSNWTVKKTSSRTGRLMLVGSKMQLFTDQTNNCGKLKALFFKNLNKSHLRRDTTVFLFVYLEQVR